MALYSENRVLSNTVLLNVQLVNLILEKVLTLYFNSVIALLQLLSFVVETRGTWVDLHGDQVWSHLHLPIIDKIESESVDKILKTFNELGKVDVKPLFRRIKEHNSVQRAIDELALEMLGLEDWKPRLDEIYDAIAKKLETMHKILETLRKSPKKSKPKIAKKEIETITKWLEK